LINPSLPILFTTPKFSAENAEMLRRVGLVGTLFLSAVSVGCGDNGGDNLDAGQTPLECAEPEPGLPGGACTVNTDCDSAPGAGDGLCLDDNDQTVWPGGGYCIRLPADEPGCDLDSDCPSGSICIDFSGTRVCLPSCCAAEDGRTGCSAGRMCAENLFGESLGGRSACVPANPEGRDGDACTDFGQCNLNSICANDPFTDPNGTCRTVGCRNDGQCASDTAVCVAIDTLDSTECYETCATDADCRTADGHFCDERMDPPVCRHGDVGDPCTDNRHCGGAPWVCLEGGGFPDGYCSVLSCDPMVLTGCPFPSHCFANSGGTPYCARDCDPMAMDVCREGYVCRESNASQPTNIQNGCLPPIVF
jgi:hypothetical protein